MVFAGLDREGWKGETGRLRREAKGGKSLKISGIRKGCDVVEKTL